MKIISHRGYWLNVGEKNTLRAFERSFEHGFGTETDIRDSLGRLVISHDIPSGKEQEFAEFLACAESATNDNNPLTLALNIKADGLAQILTKELAKTSQLDCFVFDMAIPDMRQYLAQGIPVFTRMSEVERHPAYLDEAAGVWLDAFVNEWYDNSIIQTLMNLGKRVCIVSPELHGRPYLNQWDRLSVWGHTEQVILCTDKPEEANVYFEKFLL